MKISLLMEFKSLWQSGIGTPFLDLQRVLIILEAGFIRGIAEHMCTHTQYQDSWMANTFIETEKICDYKHISFIQWIGINHHKLRVYNKYGIFLGNMSLQKEIQSPILEGFPDMHKLRAVHLLFIKCLKWTWRCVNMTSFRFAHLYDQSRCIQLLPLYVCSTESQGLSVISPKSHR